MGRTFVIFGGDEGVVGCACSAPAAFRGFVFGADHLVDADGLADLAQLRGRIARGRHREQQPAGERPGPQPPQVSTRIKLGGGPPQQPLFKSAPSDRFSSETSPRPGVDWIAKEAAPAAQALEYPRQISLRPLSRPRRISSLLRFVLPSRHASNRARTPPVRWRGQVRNEPTKQLSSPLG